MTEIITLKSYEIAFSAYEPVELQYVVSSENEDKAVAGLIAQMTEAGLVDVSVQSIREIPEDEARQLPLPFDKSTLN